MNTIEQELLGATNLPKKAREERQKYLARLVQATYKLKDDEWENLSNAAQKWYNNGAEAKKRGDDIADFPEADEEEVLEEEAEVEEEVDEAPAPRSASRTARTVKPKPAEKPSVTAFKKAKAKVKAEPKDEHTNGEDVEERPAPAKRVSKPRRASACHMIKLLVAKKPSIPTAELKIKLAQKGFTVSDMTVASLRSDTRDFLRVMNELGLGNFQL